MKMGLQSNDYCPISEQWWKWGKWIALGRICQLSIMHYWVSEHRIWFYIILLPSENLTTILSHKREAELAFVYYNSYILPANQRRAHLLSLMLVRDFWVAAPLAFPLHLSSSFFSPLLLDIASSSLLASSFFFLQSEALGVECVRQRLIVLSITVAARECLCCALKKTWNGAPGVDSLGLSTAPYSLCLL